MAAETTDQTTLVTAEEDLEDLAAEAEAKVEAQEEKTPEVKAENPDPTSQEKLSAKTQKHKKENIPNRPTTLNLSKRTVFIERLELLRRNKPIEYFQI